MHYIIDEMLRFNQLPCCCVRSWHLLIIRYVMVCAKEFLEMSVFLCTLTESIAVCKNKQLLTCRVWKGSCNSPFSSGPLILVFVCPPLVLSPPAQWSQLHSPTLPPWKTGWGEHQSIKRLRSVTKCSSIICSVTLMHNHDICQASECRPLPLCQV